MISTATSSSLLQVSVIRGGGIAASIWSSSNAAKAGNRARGTLPAFSYRS